MHIIMTSLMLRMSPCTACFAFMLHVAPAYFADMLSCYVRTHMQTPTLADTDTQSVALLIGSCLPTSNTNAMRLSSCL